MSSVSLEDRLHTPTWWETVREARQQLQLSPIPEKELEEWLTCSGGAFLPECQRVFQKLESGGLPHRYLPYFASCVLTHHQASLRPHGVPDGLIPPVLDNNLEAEGYYFVSYRPRPQSHPRRGWEVMTPLCGFLVLWPNITYSTLGDGFDRMQEREKMQGGSLTWIFRLATLVDTSSEAIEGGIAPIPLLNFPLYVGIVGLRGSGAVAYREPKIHEGLLSDPAERQLVHRWRRFLQRWSILYASEFPHLSFPPGRAQAPRRGITFTEHLLAVYKEMGGRDVRSLDKQRRLRRNALRKAERDFQGIPHERPPQKWWLL